jgi:hypothetical protein
MSRLSRTLAMACIASAALPLAHAEDQLGRLFLTPERRAVLEQQRQFNIQEQQTLQGSTMSLDGIVVRSSGKQTVWINGRTQNDNSKDLGVTTRISPANPGNAGIEAGDGASTRLHVGQKINRATREISDGLEGGRVEVKPSSQRR